VTTYRFIGAAPDVDPVSNTIVHPGDVWNFGEEPAFGRWELIDSGQSSEKPSEATEPATQPQAPAGAENAAEAGSGTVSEES
jgi:hypothetical protein